MKGNFPFSEIPSVLRPNLHVLKLLGILKLAKDLERN